MRFALHRERLPCEHLSASEQQSRGIDPRANKNAATGTKGVTALNAETDLE
jgi:hypothetical protein